MLPPGNYLANVPDTPRTPRLDDRLTVTGAWVGTPAYMAPEQIDGATVDGRTDQFAFAVSLWEALHGVRPFAGDTTLVLRSAIRRQELSGADRGDVPRWIDDILRRALRENPDDRWPSMDAILGALRHDPARRRRQIGLGVGAIALAGGAAMIAWQAKSTAPSRARCDGGAAEIATTWGPTQAAALRAHFARAQLPYAGAIADRVIATLDAYAQRWARTHATTCRARADRTWSSELADRAAACLSIRQRSLGETVGVLGELTGTQVDDAIAVVDALPSLDACSDAARLAGQPLLPTDPEEARIHDQVVTLIAQATAWNELYDPRGKALAIEAVELIARLDDPRLAAEALSVRAAAALANGDPDTIALSEEAFFKARAAGDDEGANFDALNLVVLSLRELRVDDAKRWLRHAEAGADAEATELARGHVEIMRAMIHAHTGDLDGAAKDLESARRRLTASEEGRARMPSILELESSIAGQRGDVKLAAELGRQSVATAEERYGPEHPLLPTRLANLALTLTEMGEDEDAVATMSRAVAVCRGAPLCRVDLPTNLLNLGVVQVNALQFDAGLATLAEADRALAALGDDGLSNRALVASARGRAYEALGKLELAETALRDALAMAEKANGPDHYDVAAVLNNLGNLLNAARRFAEAKPVLARAVEIWDKTSPGAPAAGLPLVALGIAQRETGQTALAIETLRAAIERLEAGGHIDQLVNARMRLAQTLWAAGKRDEARTITASLTTDGIAPARQS
jgi:tetratricopeptide (TPR) repeat protein